MTNASWKRILQRAGDDFPGEAPRLRHQLPHQAFESWNDGAEWDHRQNSRTNDFESDLRSALEQARHVPESRQKQRYTPEPTRQSASHHAPAAHATLAKARDHGQRRPLPGPMPPARRPHPAPQKKSGFRNVAVISLAAAVVAFAAHQVNQQWSQSRSGAGGRLAASTQPAYTGSVTKAGSLAAVQSQPSSGKSAAEDNAMNGPSTALNIVELQDEIQEAEAIMRAAEARSPEDVRQTASATPELSPAEEHAMAERAMNYLQAGDITTARLFYEHLANRRSVLGALSLAKTYDENVLGNLGAKGKGNVVLARKWYQRAAELGNREAAERLARLQ